MNLETAADEALNAMRQYLAALARVHELLQARVSAGDVSDEVRSTDA
jgi:hypothetical protein